MPSNRSQPTPEQASRGAVSIAEVRPGQAFAAEVEALDDLPEMIWIAGEAAAVQRLRKHLFEQRSIPRQRVSAHGYWKFGRSAT